MISGFQCRDQIPKLLGKALAGIIKIAPMDIIKAVENVFIIRLEFPCHVGELHDFLIS